MKKLIGILISSLLVLTVACSRENSDKKAIIDNPKIQLATPKGFPALNEAVYRNPPTKYGVELGKKLFHEKKLSSNNTISCGSCHQQAKAFADNHAQAIGIYDRIGLRNTPAIQNLAFIKHYNWDGSKRELEKQSLVPIITHEEMNSSIMEVMSKLQADKDYPILFHKTFGDQEISPERIYKSIAQYEYSLISANSKYDRIRQNLGEQFSESEAWGYRLFNTKCASCHQGELFTDESFRNVGFPLNPNTDEAGRARVTGIPADYMSFRVPSLRNIAYTAPYGSFGQFKTLRAVLDYFDKGVLDSDNLDPILKKNKNRIPMTSQEKSAIISFLHTLSDEQFIDNQQ
ncbi:MULTISPECIES: cytochrome-c peroxidase [Sphingobacterium]|uniref:cytochrome-c peroxidase n=1 Tax=Sphingobacterium TaxID=28453 RepID=UPI0013D9C357|nr:MULTISPECIES: cytochrome c peroxidase [unclassified Sphingobacterium]